MSGRPYVLVLFAACWGLAIGPDAAGQAGPSLDELRARLLQGDPQAVMSALADEPADGWTAEQAFLLGKAYQAAMRWEDAAALFRRADTSRVVTLVELATVLDRGGEDRQALSTAQRAHQRDPSNRVAAMLVGRLLVDSERWTEAAALFRHLTQIEPKNSVFHAQLGQAYARLDSIKWALVHFETALQLDPGNSGAALALSSLYLEMDYLHSARGALNRALRRRPDHIGLLRRSGEIALKEGSYERAYADFAGARERGDRSPETLRNHGVSAYLLDSMSVALDLLQLAWAADSSDYMGALYLGMAHARRSENAEAARLLDRAAKLGGQPFVADVYVRLGSLSQAENRIAEAVERFELALRLDETRADITFYLAAVHEGTQGDRRLALRSYEAFLRDPQHGRYPELTEIARRRVRQIREVLFLEAGRRAVPDTVGSSAPRLEQHDKP